MMAAKALATLIKSLQELQKKVQISGTPRRDLHEQVRGVAFCRPAIR